MRLRSVTLRNYRIHEDFRVDFDARRTLIGGPNECGKSTLMEAIHRAFFLKAKGSTEHHRLMTSIHGGEPEVEIAFSFDGNDYLLRKHFGSRGTTVLIPTGGTALRGEEAETELSRLLRLPNTITRKDLPGHWSHVWVRQGFSGTDPSQDAIAQQAPLLQRLQQIGGAAAAQSDLDTQLARHFSDERKKTFTDTSKVKAGSDLAEAQRRVEEATGRKQLALERQERLNHAVGDYESASRNITESEKNLEILTKEKTKVDDRVRKVELLRKQEEVQGRIVKDTEIRITEIEAASQRITALRKELDDNSARLAPLLASCNELEKKAKRAKEEAQGAQKALEDASDAVRHLRKRRDFLAATHVHFQRTEELKQWQERLANVETLRNQLTKVRTELAKLPPVDDKALDRLRSAEGNLSTTRAALNAMSAELELLEGDVDQEVFVGDQKLTVGERHTMVSETEIRIGDRFRLRIQPGGGKKLAEAGSTFRKAEAEFRQMLKELGVASVEQAFEVLVRRREQLAQVEKTEDALAEWDEAKLPQRLQKAKDAALVAESELQRRKVESVALPASPEEAAALLNRAEAELTTAEATEAEAKGRRDVHARTSSENEEEFTSKRAAMDGVRQKVNELRVQLRTLEETHGDTEARTRQLTQLRSALEGAQRQLVEIKESLSGLNADHVTADVQRLQRALQSTHESLNHFRTQRAVAQATLTFDGSHDLQGDLALAAAQLETAQARLGAIDRKAAAIQLLDTLFVEEQQALARRFTQPLAEKISGYLECLFGSGVRAEVRFNQSGFEGLELTRGEWEGSLRFDALSGGTKEQVAAAMRLAMAEILADDFGGCLPVIFDDAFAYADPLRVQSLQRMLDLAAERGLQVIVLTCNPTDYVTLGAKQIILSPRPRTHRNPLPSSPVAGISNQAPGDVENGAERFLKALEEAGGSAGNTTLMQTLGWSESTYSVVKQELLAGGKITTGRGRGGSVNLAIEREADCDQPV